MAGAGIQGRGKRPPPSRPRNAWRRETSRCAAREEPRPAPCDLQWAPDADVWRVARQVGPGASAACGGGRPPPGLYDHSRARRDGRRLSRHRRGRPLAGGQALISPGLGRMAGRSCPNRRRSWSGCSRADVASRAVLLHEPVRGQRGNGGARGDSMQVMAGCRPEYVTVGGAENCRHRPTPSFKYTGRRQSTGARGDHG